MKDPQPPHEPGTYDGQTEPSDGAYWTWHNGRWGIQEVQPSTVREVDEAENG